MSPYRSDEELLQNWQVRVNCVLCWKHSNNSSIVSSIPQAMGIFKVIKAAVGGGTKVTEPEMTPPPPLIDMIVSRLTNVPRDPTSLFYCVAMSISICFVVVLAMAQLRGQSCLKEESGEQEESHQKETLEVGDLMGKIIDATADAEQDDTADETVSKDDSKPFDDPPTPTMPPPAETVDVNEADKNSSDAAQSIPDIESTSPPRRISSRKYLLAAKAKYIGGSIRRLSSNGLTSKFNTKKQRTKE